MTPEALLTRMQGVSRSDTARATASILDRLQHQSPQVQITATAMVFWRMCRVLGVRETDVLAVVNNLFSDGQKPAPEFRATDDYLKCVLKSQD